MIEIPTSRAHEAAFEAARAERARVFVSALAGLARPFRWLRQPQVGACRPWSRPQARPAGC